MKPFYCPSIRSIQGIQDDGISKRGESSRRVASLIPFTFATEIRSKNRRMHKECSLPPVDHRLPSHRKTIAAEGRLEIALVKWLQRALELRKKEKSVHSNRLYANNFRSQKSTLRDYIHGLAPAPYSKQTHQAVQHQIELSKKAILLKKVESLESATDRKMIRGGSQTARVRKVCEKNGYETDRQQLLKTARQLYLGKLSMDRLKFGTQEEVKEYCRLWRWHMGITPEQKVKIMET